MACAAPPPFFPDRRAAKTLRAPLRPDLAIEALLAVGVDNARHQFVFAIAARGVADHPLFVGKLRFERKRVFPSESDFRVGHLAPHLLLSAPPGAEVSSCAGCSSPAPAPASNAGLRARLRSGGVGRPLNSRASRRARWASPRRPLTAISIAFWKARIAASSESCASALS